MNNDSNNVFNLPGASFPSDAGSGQDLIGTDAGYLRWIRLTANDQQLLELRDELRKFVVLAQQMPQIEANHQALQAQYVTTLQILSLLIKERAEASEPGPLSGEVLAREHVSIDQLKTQIEGTHLEVQADDHNTGWWFILREGSEAGDEVNGSPGGSSGQ